MAVTIEGDLVAQTLLQDEKTISVPLKAILATGRRQIEAALHVALSAVEGADVELRRSGLLLTSLHLEGGIDRPAPPVQPIRNCGTTLSEDIVSAGLIAKTLRSRDDVIDDADIAGLADKTAAIERGIRALAPQAVLPILFSEEVLTCLCDIGGALAEFGETLDAGEEKAFFSTGIISADPAKSVRVLALAMLTTRPWDLLEGCEIGALPDIWRVFPEISASYLCSTSHRLEGEDGAAYETYVIALLDYARVHFLTEPKNSRQARLAEEILRQFHPRPALFASGSLCEIGKAFASALEAYLVMRGDRITLTRKPDSSMRRLRLGVLVRDLDAGPETMILAGTVGTLPSENFDVKVFVVDRRTSKPSALPDHMTIIDLDGAGIERSVETIRAEHLDVFLLGAAFQSYGDIAPIVAHRLAPVQIATSAVSPMTTGLRSFDVMLSSVGCEPEHSQSHYTERLELSPDMVQRFDFGSEAAVSCNRMLERAKRGIASDAVVLTSGAVVHKINLTLLECWISILAATPTSELVLYPSATNWKLGLPSRSRLTRDVARICKNMAVDRRRVHILPAISSVEVATILRISDVYLDSFPYAGATTVIEAMRAGLPVVTMKGKTQRGLQGAAWASAFGLDRLLAATPGQYVAIATELANNPHARSEAVRALSPPESDERTAFGRRFAALITRIAGRDLSLNQEPNYVVHQLDRATGEAALTHLRAIPGAAGLLHSHFRPDYPIVADHPEGPNTRDYRLMTWLRDPLETAIARYGDRRRPRGGAPPLTLDAFLETCPPYLERHLLSLDRDWRTALDRYWFVGTCDRLEEGIAWFAKALDKPFVPAEPKTVKAPAGRPSEAAIESFLRRNPQEYEIYRAACAREDSILKRAISRPINSRPS